jgi:hypothetical protein
MKETKADARKNFWGCESQLRLINLPALITKEGCCGEKIVTAVVCIITSFY